MNQIYVVEAHLALLETLCALIERDPDVTVCGSATSAEEALQELPPLTPELVLVEHALPDMSGSALLDQLWIGQPDLRAIMLTGLLRARYLPPLRNGVAAYVDKLDAYQTLLPTIRKALSS